MTTPPSTTSEAFGVNDAGQVVGFSNGSPVPESSTRAMMLLGFAGLGFAGWRGSRRTGAFAG
jgi:hypothetical protein